MVPLCQKTEVFLDGEGCCRVSTGHQGHPALEPGTHAHHPGGILVKPLHKGSLVPTMILSNKMSVRIPCLPAQSLSHVRLFVTLWSVACQAPLSMGFPRQEYLSGCHFLLQGIFPTQELNPHLLHWQVDSLPLSQGGSPSVPITSLNIIRMLGHHQFLLLVVQLWRGENDSIVLTEQRVMKSLHGQHCGTAVSPSFGLTETCFCQFHHSANKVKSESQSRSVVSNSLHPMDCIVHGILQARILEFPSSGDLPNPGI